MSYDIYLNIFTGKENTCVCDVGNHTSNTSKMWHDAMDPDYFKAMNPSNGWGSYETALQYMQTFLEKCKEHPLTIVEISR